MATDYSVPRSPKAGERLTARWGMALNRAISDLRPVQVPGMLISRGTYGTKYTPLEQSVMRSIPTRAATAPFFLRYHEAAEDGQEGDNRHRQVEAYLPRGSMTTRKDCVPLNPPACLVEGHGEDDPAWRVVTPRSGNWTDGVWRIQAFVMPGDHMILRGTKAREADGSASAAPAQDAYDKGAVAVYFLSEMTVGTDEETGEKIVTFGEQANTGAKSLTNNALYELSCCSLDYAITETYDSAKKCYSYALGAVTMKNVLFDAGGDVLVGADAAVPSDAESAWLKVNHTDEDYSVEAVFDPDDTTNTDDATWRKMYDLDSRYPTADVRFVNNTLLYLR